MAGSKTPTVAADAAAQLTAHLAAQATFNQTLATMPQNQMLAMVGNALAAPDVVALSAVLAAAAPNITDAITKANLLALVDLLRIAPSRIAILATPAAAPVSAKAAS